MGEKDDELVVFALNEGKAIREMQNKGCSRGKRETGSAGESEERVGRAPALLKMSTVFSVLREKARWWW